MGNITIRRAEITDAEALADCMANIHAEDLDTIFKRNKPTLTDAQQLIQLVGLMANSFLLIAEEKGRIVAMLDFTAFKDIQRSHSGMFGISVVKEFRSKGIGQSLIEMLLKELKNTNISRVELQVFSNNPKAVKLYESLGFEHEGRKRRAVRIGDKYCDILLMAKFLKA
ncbi:MAG TPA: GNAT family protein [Patescibacteria group bacterium]|nr:GNAT family protein [Patescibacteria group bacterium]